MKSIHALKAFSDNYTELEEAVMIGHLTAEQKSVRRCSEKEGRTSL